MGYQELVSSQSPSQANVSYREGGISMPCQVVRSDESTGFWTGLFDYFIGGVNNVDAANSKGTIERVLPVAHADMPWMFCTALKGIRGKGQAAAFYPISPLAAPSMSGFAAYAMYDFVAEFQPRTYPVIPDSFIPGILTASNTAAFVDTDGTNKTYQYASEWLRYLDIDEQTVVEVVQAKHGQQTFLASGGGGPPNDPGGTTFPGTVSMRLPRTIISAKWYQVPYRYVTSPNSYLKLYQGRVNQSQFLDYPKGSLLYMGFKVTKYMPAVPTWYLDRPKFVQTGNKLCDIEFMWEHVDRVTGSPPDNVDMPNGNFIAAGHNLLPWYGNRMFYYAVNKADGPIPPNSVNKNKWYPTYLSFPFELLFTDPDAKTPNPF